MHHGFKLQMLLEIFSDPLYTFVFQINAKLQLESFLNKQTKL